MTPEDIINRHLKLAKEIASKYADKNRANDYDELLSAAHLGLVKASKTGIGDVEYVATRIRGEVLDAMRESDILSRLDRAILKAMEHFEDIEVVAQYLGRTQAFIQQRLNNIKTSVNMSQVCVDATYEDSRFDETLEECLSVLPERLHEVFLAFYRDGRSRKEMARLLHIPRPTVTDYMREISSVLHSFKDVLRETLL